MVGLRTAGKLNHSKAVLVLEKETLASGPTSAEHLVSRGAGDKEECLEWLYRHQVRHLELEGVVLTAPRRKVVSSATMQLLDCRDCVFAPGAALENCPRLRRVRFERCTGVLAVIGVESLTVVETDSYACFRLVRCRPWCIRNHVTGETTVVDAAKYYRSLARTQVAKLCATADSGLREYRARCDALLATIQRLGHQTDALSTALVEAAQRLSH